MNLTNKDIHNFFKVNKQDSKQDTFFPQSETVEVKVMDTIKEEETINLPDDDLEVDSNLEEIIQNIPSSTSLDNFENESENESENENENKKETSKEEETDDCQETEDSQNNDSEKELNTKDIEDNLEEEIIPDEKDLDKIDNRQKQKKEQINLLLRIFKLLKFHTDTMEDLTNLTFPRETLIQKENKEKLLELIPELKKVYNSSYLTCLHDNSIYKQKFPAINLVRQVLKCHHLSLTPKIMSNGYEKTTGKKRVSRIFKIEKQLF